MEGKGIESRLKSLRKALKGMKQGEFAKKIGLKQGSYSDIENGKETLTDRNIKLICLTFGVSETWLRMGKGEVFTTQPSPSALEKDEDRLLSMFKQLSAETQKAVLKVVQDLLSAKNSTKGEPPTDTGEPAPDNGQAAGNEKARKGA
jgi:transcriptional regulator with XRE-family HTH domain